jgi:hypothetical protein
MYCIVELVTTLDGKGDVMGIAVLDDELFVRFDRNQNGKAQTSVAVYNALTYKPKQSLRVPGLGDVTDMTSCRRFHCLYITDDTNWLVHKIENRKVVGKWSVGANPEGLSINCAHNVLVTCYDKGTVKEFTTYGNFVREINLQRDIVHPWHTVELAHERYVVCHGNEDDPLHRVCIVDASGTILKAFGGWPGSDRSSLNVPTRLAVNGFIFVADTGNDRVVLLNPSLVFVRAVAWDLDELSRLWFDEQTGLLYTGLDETDEDYAELKIYRVYDPVWPTDQTFQ